MADHTEESIHDAIRSGNIERVHKILRRNPSCVDNLDEYLKAPLHLVNNGINLEDVNQEVDERLAMMMQLLLNYGADVNVADKYYRTPLHQAIMKHQVKGVELLLENKADPNMRDIYSYTSLISAVIIGCNDENDDKIIKLLLDYKAHPNLTDGFGDTALDMALQSNRLDYVKILLSFGARVKNVYQAFIKILLAYNIFIPRNGDYLALVNFLWIYIDIAMNQLAKPGQHFISNFGYSCKSRRYNKEKRILAFLESLRIRGIVVNYGDSNLHSAVRKGNVMFVKHILEREETSVNAKNSYSDTPLHLIFNLEDKISSKEIGCLLLNAGADWRASNLIDETPFYLAVDAKYYTLVNLILKKISRDNYVTLECHKINLPTLKICYTENDVALHELLVAICVNCEPAVDRLLDNDYNIDEASKHNRRDITIALRTAIEVNNCNIVKKLLEAGFRSDRRFPRDLIISRSNGENTIKISCLLREFNDRESLVRLTYNTVFYYSSNSEPNVIINQLLFYYIIDEYVEESVTKPTKLQTCFNKRTILAKKYAECKKDLLQMKNIKLAGVSVFDIITMNLDLLVKMLNNEKFQDDCMIKFSELKNSSEFKFKVMLQYRLELALEKNRAMNAALCCFDDISKKFFTRTNLTTFPYTIGWNIFSNLNMRDLKKFVQSNV